MRMRPCVHLPHDLQRRGIHNRQRAVLLVQHQQRRTRRLPLSPRPRAQTRHSCHRQNKLHARPPTHSRQHPRFSFELPSPKTNRDILHRPFACGSKASAFTHSARRPTCFPPPNPQSVILSLSNKDSEGPQLERILPTQPQRSLTDYRQLITRFLTPQKKKRANPQRASSPTERLPTPQPFSGYSRPNIENGIARDFGPAPAPAAAAATAASVLR